jgi:nucleotide-binding universal stress UspA family protein
MVQPSFKNILVAVDFSATSDAAWKQAIWLAKQTESSVTLLHAIADSTPLVRSNSVLDALFDQASSDIQLQNDSDRSLRRMVTESKVDDMDVECVTVLGEPFVEIIQLVQEEGYDLVLAGSQGHSALERFFVGSTAKRLIRKCPSAVWIVKPEHIDSMNVVLAATDFSHVSHKAVIHGLKIAKQAGAQFHLLHVIDSKDVPEDLVSHIPKGSTMRNEINEEAKRRFGEFIETLDQDGIEIHSHLSFGTPWQEIQRIIKEKNVDLLAMGTVGRSGIRGLLLGNTAERILDTCDCSILTVKPDGFVSPIAPEV